MILLLDALDEDPLAIRDLDGRLATIVEVCQDFRTVLITCRTQFFPSEEKEPGETKIRKYGTKGGFQEFEKIYVAPFSNKDIQSYLRRRFPFWRMDKRRQGKKIVDNTPKIMVRPMVLANIDDLINNKQSYAHAHEIYQGIIDSWIEREGEKFSDEKRRAKFKSDLLQFSERLALDMYERFRAGTLMYLKENEFEKLSSKYDIQLDELEMKSRSLLNRNAVGQWKFSHKSIMEYFLAKKLDGDFSSYRNTDFEGLDMAQQFCEEMFHAPKIRMISVEGGSFNMGSNEHESEQPIHSATLDSFEIGQYPVTQSQWVAVMKKNPSHIEGCQDCPVERVSWHDVQEFIQKLNALYPGMNYRLPTEAEWEFAARGGTQGGDYTYAGSNDAGEVGWYANNSNGKTQSVGQKKPNELGLYDMSGNVWEWCQDWYGNYPSEPQTNPKGPSSGTRRVLRGGSWLNRAVNLRVADRGSYGPVNSGYGIGFRLARTP